MNAKLIFLALILFGACVAQGLTDTITPLLDTSASDTYRRDVRALQEPLKPNKPCGAGKQCVRGYLCSENGETIKDGATLFEIRVDDDDDCHFLEVCCSVGSIVTKSKDKGK